MIGKASAILIGCVKGKKPGIHRASDLYTSTLFQGRRDYAEASGAPWFVLSAKYGLLHPDDEVATYDAALKDFTRPAGRDWSDMVLRQIADAIPRLSGTIEIHAGKEYRDYGLAAGLETRGLRVVVPLGHLGLGQQLAWYKQRQSR